MREVKSDECDLVQLTDVLMGAYKSNGCTNEIKIEMSKYVIQKLDEIRSKNEKRFRIYEWEFR